MTAPEGPHALLDAAGRARSELSSVGALAECSGSREEWAAALGEL